MGTGINTHASKIEVGASPQIRRAEGVFGPLEASGEDGQFRFAILLANFELEPGKVHKYACTILGE